MKIAITGSTGFVGSCVAAQFAAAGHQITRLSRDSFLLERGLTTPLAGFDAMIHAAYDFTSRDDRNVAGSVRLFEQAKAAGVEHLIFISSLSAFPGCLSQYGAGKLAVERELERIGGKSVRLGFVCDDSGRGLSGALKRLATLPIVPLPDGGAQNLYLIRAAELGSALSGILRLPERATVALAHPAPLTFAEMMRGFARKQNHRPLFVPVPWRVLWAPLRLAEASGFNLKLRSDSLVSLMNQNPDPDFHWMSRANISLQAVAIG
jgi:nucleoside-diphosphate-sugar epimerase